VINGFSESEFNLIPNAVFQACEEFFLPSPPTTYRPWAIINGLHKVLLGLLPELLLPKVYSIVISLTQPLCSVLTHLPGTLGLWN
jgi:hypothetical protein